LPALFCDAAFAGSTHMQQNRIEYLKKYGAIGNSCQLAQIFSVPVQKSNFFFFKKLALHTFLVKEIKI
jgi:hypothetical protein